MRFELPHNPWHGFKWPNIETPDHWEVEYCPMQGGKTPALSLEEISQSLANPIGTGGLREKARNKQRAVIVFDDMTRPTRTYEIAPILIAELLAGGLDLVTGGTDSHLLIDQFGGSSQRQAVQARTPAAPAP